MNQIQTAYRQAPATIQGGIIQPSADIDRELMARWIKYVNRRPKTVQTYTRSIRRFADWLSIRGISRPGTDDINEYVRYLSQDHKATTVQGYMNAVKLFFKWTALEGIYPDIAARVTTEKPDKGFKKDYMTSGQVKRTLDGIERDGLKGLRDYAIFALTVTAGLRTIELSRADVGDIRTVGDERRLYVQGKGRADKTDYVKVPPEIEGFINEYLKARAQADGKRPAETAPLFASLSNRDSGGRMTTRSLSRLIKERMQSAGFDSDKLTAHSLRHTAAVLNLMNGGTVEETRELLRHSNINTTLIYSHEIERNKNQSEARIARAIFS